VIYRQFALTIALSMAFSAFLALSFTPALCATLLRAEHLRGNFLFNWFNRAYERTQKGYVHRVYQSVAHTPRWMIGFAVIVVLAGFLFLKLPGSFVPEEDQGYALLDVQLPRARRSNARLKCCSKWTRYCEAIPRWNLPPWCRVPASPAMARMSGALS